MSPNPSSAAPDAFKAAINAVDGFCELSAILSAIQSLSSHGLEVSGLAGIGERIALEHLGKANSDRERFAALVALDAPGENGGEQ